MIIRKYIVNDMKEAVTRAKYELGREAIIISQREIKIGKWYNPFKMKRLEVTVALEEKIEVDSNARKLDNVTTRFENPETITNNLHLGWNNPATGYDNPTTGYDNPPSPKETFKEEYGFNKPSEKVMEQLLGYPNPNVRDDYHIPTGGKKDFLRRALKDNCFDKKLELCKINVMIGPTGVGKTTTIAKIAAKESLINKKQVGLITMDTYRIGAVDQLRTYANILDIPFEVVNKPNEMKEKIEKLSFCDIILIDTLGTSPKNQDKIDDIKEYIQVIDENKNTYLVLSITTDRDTTLSILNRYKQLNYDALILTKLDEVNNLSNFWCIIENNSFPVQFICNGQDVPDDIQDATLDRLFDYFEENYHYD